MNYSFNEVIKFILRFKIMGDKIQALEAKYRCSLLKDYDSTPEDILIQKRILATQDRPLAAFAMVENNINFNGAITFTISSALSSNNIERTIFISLKIP